MRTFYTNEPLPPEVVPLFVILLFIGVLWWTVRRIWLKVADRPADRRPWIVRWYEGRGATARGSIKMGWVVALIGVGFFVFYSGTIDTSPNSILGLALIAIGFAQLLYGSLVPN